MDDSRRLPQGGITAPDLMRYRTRTAPAPDTLNERRKAKQEEAVRPKFMHVSLPSVFLYVVAVFSAMLIVYCNMQLSTVYNESSALKKQLTAAQKEGTELGKKLESKINLVELERIAVEEYQMIKPHSENIVFVDLCGTDYAVVYEQPGFFNTVKKLFSDIFVSVGEYFK